MRYRLLVAICILTGCNYENPAPAADPQVPTQSVAKPLEKPAVPEASPQPGPDGSRATSEIDSNSEFKLHKYKGGDLVGIAVEPPSDENLARLKHFPKLESVYLSVGFGITEKGISSLASLPKLRSVHIHQWLEAVKPAHDPYDLPGLGKIKQIEELSVEVPINEKSAKEILQLTNLRKLRLESMTDVAEASIQALGNLTALESLDIGLPDLQVVQSSTTDKYAIDSRRTSLFFLKKLQKLRSLSIDGNVAVSDEVLSSLQELPHLQSLEISIPLQLTPDAVKKLEKLTTLQSLSVRSWRPRGYDSLPEEPLKVSEADLVKLSNTLNLKHFKYSLDDTQNGSDLDKFTNLEHLHICGLDRTKAAVPLRLNLSKDLQVLEFDYLDSLTDADLAKIAKHTGLKKLILKSCHGITDVGIAHLAKMKTLTHLKVDYCNKVTPAAAKVLRAAMPHVQIEFAPE